MPQSLPEEHRRTLLQVAATSIEYGVQRGEPLPVQAADYAPVLQALGMSFVTLKLHGQLQGCIGALQAARPLVVDVAQNAYAAGFNDPRGGVLSKADLPRLEISISILSPSEPLRFSSEPELLAQLRPGIDGLTLQEGRRRGTLLPSVWESLPQAAAFLAHLKLKAGFPSDYWSSTLTVSRYTAEYFSRQTPPPA